MRIICPIALAIFILQIVRVANISKHFPERLSNIISKCKTSLAKPREILAVLLPESLHFFLRE
jgi:hypothetical protein